MQPQRRSPRPRTSKARRAIRILRAPALLAALLTPSVAAQDLPVLKLLTEEPGAYEVSWEDLRVAHPPLTPVASSVLALSNRGRPVPIWVEDGGDGEFGPGDRIEFVAEILPGVHGRFHEHSRYNVYLLAFDGRGTRMQPARSRAQKPGRAALPAALRGSLHEESDSLLMRFSCRHAEEHEQWYWAELSCIAAEPFTATLTLPDLDRRSGGTVDLAVDLHGWSRLHAPDIPDHVVEIALNGEPLAAESWDDRCTKRLELSGIPVERFNAGPNTLSLSVPRREEAENGNLIVDVSVVNWIRVDYPKQPVLGPQGQTTFELPGNSGRSARIIASAGSVLYGNGGQRIVVPDSAGEPRQLEVPAAAAPYWEAPPGSNRHPAAIARLRDGGLAGAPRRADYLVVTHPDLARAIAPLVEYRRAQGLAVEVVDVFEIYDAFHHGIPAPEAIRDFISHAYHDWTPPAPRFVLLVGDASWDTKNSVADAEKYALKTQPLQSLGVGRPEGPAYPDAGPNTRGLVPTWQYIGVSGHAASDNWFVCVDGDDHLPDLAIGRLPVVRPEEVTAIVDKTIAYETAAGSGPWRQSALWVTNEVPSFQQQADDAANLIGGKGWTVNRVYPKPGEAGSAGRIVAALDEGQALVYFYGHGGRNVWRTSPEDLQETQDLFTLEHLDELTPTVRTPIVASFTCYSSPFDHPVEDSIGEKFLRLPGRGAVAVIGASWRNSPVMSMQREFLDALTDGGTLGEALMTAKRRLGLRELVEIYNLLGDPAIPLPLTRDGVTLDVERSESGGAWLVRGEIRDPELRGGGVVEWRDPLGNRVRSVEFEAGGAAFEVRFDDEPALPVPGTVHCYVWNHATGRSGEGRLQVGGDAPSPAATRSGASRKRD